MFTFVASGLLHEYILLMMSASRDDARKQAYDPTYGRQFLFFLWSGVVLLLEGVVKKHAVFQWMNRTLPRPVRTCLVLMTFLPAAHLFIDDYVGCGFFTDVALGFPKISWLGKATA